MPTVKVGFDFGTNTSVVAGEREGKRIRYDQDLITSVVGYARTAVLPGVLPGNGTQFFSEEAVKYRRYLDLKWPMEEGIVRYLTASFRVSVTGRGCRCRQRRKTVRPIAAP